MRHSTLTKRGLRYSLVGVLLASCAPATLHAEPSLAELAAEIQALKADNQRMKAENREMKAAISDIHGETRRTREKVREVAARGPAPAYALPPPGAPYPVGAVPAFVTADKKLIFGGITITPGGFLAAEGVFRSRTEQADISSNYQAIPFGPLGATNEYRLSARQSRIALLAEGAISPTMLAGGYMELDFLGAGTANANESNSYSPRIRHLYATLDNSEYGLHLLAGQEWSLVTLNSKGITPRNEVTPPTIDAQYVPGFDWKRQAQIRLTKDFDKKLWLSVSAEEAQTTFGSACTTGVNGTAVAGVAGAAATNVTCTIAGTGNLNGLQNYSLNHVPDVVGKAAYEARFADRDVHLEAYGLYRDLYDRISNAAGTFATNQDTTGYGVGGGLIVPLLPKKLDFQLSGMYGRGIGSYGTAQFGDVTFASNGALKPLREEMALAGLTLHATPAIDVYGFAGIEQVQDAYYATNAAGTAFAGYGVPTANNSGCFNYVTAGACAGSAKRIYQFTGGVWDKVYTGSFGEVRAGLQYAYTKRELFQGNGGAAATPALAFAPKTDDQTFLTSFRYYPFQSTPVAPAPVVAKY